MPPENAKARLIESVIRLGAEVGIEKVTTKGIMKDSGINEAYIYHYFAGKDDLLTQAFLQLANNIALVVAQSMQPILQQAQDRPTRNREMFQMCWDHLTANAQRCLFYLRFRFCSLYTPELHRRRNEIWAPIIKAMRPYFPQYGDPTMPIDHMIDSAIRYASDVAEGIYPDNEATVERVYQIVWGVVDLDTGATR